MPAIANIPRVFLDTSVIKHSFRAQTLLQPRLQQVEWGDQVLTLQVHDIVTFDPASRITNKRLRREVDLLKDIAQMAKDRKIELLWHVEVTTELASISMFPSGGKPEFLKLDLTAVESPIEYSRRLLPMNRDSASGFKEAQIEFLRGIASERFLQLQLACGAYQGESTNENQLIDAFHIWCAEHGEATHFLTTDMKLMRTIRNHKRYPPLVSIVLPSMLLTELGQHPSEEIGERG